MGTNNSKLKDRKPEGTPVLSTSNSSSKSLIYKIHNNLYRSNQSSSEKINEVTSSPTSYKKKLFKRRPNTVEQDDDTSDLCPVSSTEDLTSNTSSIHDDPMIATATRISARFDEERSSLSQSSSDLCMVPCLIHATKDQSSPVTATEHLKGSSPLENHKRTKDWLNNAPNYEKVDDGTFKQNMVFSFFLQLDNAADQRKEKERQQRLVNNFSFRNSLI